MDVKVILRREELTNRVGEAVTSRLGRKILARRRISIRGVSDREIRKGVERAIARNNLGIPSQWSPTLAAIFGAVGETMSVPVSPELVYLGRNPVIRKQGDLADSAPVQYFYLVNMREIFLPVLYDFLTASDAEAVVQRIAERGQYFLAFLELEATRRIQEGEGGSVVSVSNLMPGLLASWWEPPTAS